MRLDVEKATQALNYFTQHEGGTIDKMKALKLVFFADRYHLRKYGRPVLRDHYKALKYGPVASTAYDLLQNKSEWVGVEACAYASRFLRPIHSPAGPIKTVASAHAPDLDVFSQTDLEALEFAYQQFGHQTGWALSMLTHVYPEWTRHQQALLSQGAVPMDYLDFFEDPSPADCAELGFTDPYPALVDAELLALSKEDYLERKALDDLMAV